MFKKSLLILLAAASTAQLYNMVRRDQTGTLPCDIIGDTIKIWDISALRSPQSPPAPPAPGAEASLAARDSAEQARAREIAGLTIRVQGQYVYAKAKNGPLVIFDFSVPEYPHRVTAEEVKAQKAADRRRAAEKKYAKDAKRAAEIDRELRDVYAE